MDKIKELSKWYNSFNTYCTSKIYLEDNYFNKCLENHKEINKILGNEIYERKIEIDSSTDSSLIIPYIESSYAQLQCLISEYFYKYNLRIDSFLTPGYINPNNNKVISWGKHIHGYLKKNEYSEDFINQVNNVVSNFFQKLEGSKKNKITLYVYLITKPQAFCQIGIYGPDNSSCFRYNAINEVHKYIIGQTKNSFVGLISKVPINIDTYFLEKKEILCRFFGVLQNINDNNIFDVFNIYKNSLTEATVTEVLKETFSNIFKSEISIIKNRFMIKGIFQNKNENFSIIKKDSNFEGHFIEMDKDGLNNLTKCVHCYKCDDKVKQLENTFYCMKCINSYYGVNCPVCEFSNNYSKSGLNEARDCQNKKIMISQHTIDFFFRLCSKTGLYYRHEDLIKGINKFK